MRKYLQLALDGRIIWVFLFFAVSSMSSYSYAKPPYTKTNEITCGGVKIQVVTKCAGESNPVVPDCTEQNFLFTSQATNKTLSKNASGNLTTIKGQEGKVIGRYLDALATGWICSNGAAQAYLIVWYNTGGNCDECEWQEIYDLNGKKIASTLPKTKLNLKSFDAIWSKLGLPDIRAKDYLRIPLK